MVPGEQRPGIDHQLAPWIVNIWPVPISQNPKLQSALTLAFIAIKTDSCFTNDYDI